VHVAGALGKPCWLMLPHDWTDWRWMMNRDESPWYQAPRPNSTTPSRGSASGVPRLAFEKRAIAAFGFVETALKMGVEWRLKLGGGIGHGCGA
jgi:hypothetical protein